MSAMFALVLGVLAALGTVLASVRVRRPAASIFPVMMVSWLVGELAVFHLVLQTAAIAVLVGTGALNRGSGEVGVALLAASVVGLVQVQYRASRAHLVLDRALRDGFGPTYPEHFGAESASAVTPPPPSHAWRPFHFDRRGLEVIHDVAYGEHPKRHRLDIYRPAGTTPADGLPVVVFVHGGAWMIGNKEQQGKPLMCHLARRGYLAVTINYRLAPRHRWPAQIIDVKRAIAWVHEHGGQYGGDASFLAVAGSSAGGHLVALCALTPGDAAFQPGFETADTSVSACIPIYAPFDLTDSARLRGLTALHLFLERLVMPTKLHADPAGWQSASPLFRIHAAAPPMFVIQGAIDTLVWREESRNFVDALRAVSDAPVVFAELPATTHAFEVFNSVRSRAAVDAIARFLAVVHREQPARR